MYERLTYLAKAYFHQDYQDEAGTPIEIVEKVRDSESAGLVAALRAEVVALLESDLTEEDLTRIWVDEADSYYEPDDDDLTTREWLQKIADVLALKAAPAEGDETPPVTPAENPADPGAGIPFKGSAGA